MKGLLTIFSLLCSAFLLGQDPYLRHFDVDDGLPSPNIYRVTQDSKGYIWICTDKGIVHFDGYTFKTYGTKDDLPYNDFWEAKEDSRGRIWFSTYGTHFVHYDYKDRKFHVKRNKVKLAQKSHPAEVSVEDINGDIWYRCRYDLMDVDKDTLVKQLIFNVPYKLLNRFIYNDHRYSIIEAKNKLSDKENIFKVKNNAIGDVTTIWFLSEYSFLHFDNIQRTLSYYNPLFQKTRLLLDISPYPIEISQPLGVFALNKSEIFINTFRDCFVIDTNLNRLSQYDFLHTWELNSICEDREDNRWICTKNNGLYLLTAHAAQTQTFTFPQEHNVRAITADKTGRIWLATSLGQVFYLEKDSLNEIFFNKPNNLNIRDMMISDKNTLLIAFENYTVLYPLQLINQNKQKKEKSNALKIEEFKCIGDTCLMTSFEKTTKKVMIKSKGSLRNFYLKKNGDLLFSLPFVNKYAVFSDKNSTQGYISYNTDKRTLAVVEAKINNENTWVGTTEGLFFYWKNKNLLDNINNLKIKHALITQPILDMATDSSGNIWVGTDGFGLYRIKSEENENWNESDNQLFEIEELKGKIIKSVFIDSRNHIWAATNQGVYEVVMIDEDKTPQAKVKRYSIADGVPSNQVNCVYVNQDYIYIGTAQGLTKIPIKMREILEWKVPLDLHVKINGKDTLINSPIKLSYTQNNLSFAFVCLSFKSDKNITYSFRMRKDKEDSNWETTTETYKDFPLLIEGDYIFEVKAQEINGKETTVQSISFSISPPWWRNTLFQAICIIAFLGITFAIYRWQVRELKRVSQLELTAEQTKTQINRERAENLEMLAKYQNQITDLEGKTLLSQMNPHFIFNVLTSIQSFVLNNEPYISHDYLTRFAKLIRSFLDASREKYISIEKEYELIKNYIELEQLRFNHLFEVDISIDAGTDPNIEIPPMFLQPFVENAINHGLKYKGGNGHLKIHFSEENDSNLLCIIEDDGVGRQKAKELQSMTLRGHRSLASQIIQERIKLLSDLENWHIELRFIDKEDKEGNSLGTRVELRFPFR